MKNEIQLEHLGLTSLTPNEELQIEGGRLTFREVLIDIIIGAIIVNVIKAIL